MFEIVAMTREDALVISHWQYEGEYEMYNFEETQELLNELTDGSYFACYHQENGLVGYFCFGNSARIPLSDEEQSVYQKQLLDIGLGMDPLRTRQGHGFYEGRAYLCPSAVSCRWLSLDSSLL